jgi:AraC-like DNA-binding protein
VRIESNLLVNGKCLVKQNIKDGYDDYSLINEETVIVKGQCLEMAKSKQWSTTGLLVLDTEMLFTSRETDHFTIDGECIVMDFMHNNNVTVEIEDLGNPGYTHINTHNIWYASNFSGNYDMPPFEKVCYMVVIMSKEFYRQLFSTAIDLHPEFSVNIEQSKSGYLFPKYLPFSPGIQWILQEIRNCQREGIFKRIFLETKIRELLLLQLEMHASSSIAATADLNPSELEKLHEAKAILDTGFVHPPSLMELSRKISLNEFKLKKGFKSCFGDTVRGYIIKLRMNHARKLLKSKMATVSDVAYECGYKDVSHFSAAFKGFHGFSPKKSMNISDITKVMFYGLFFVGF